MPDIAGFLRLVTPVLERRLADSAAAGYGGRLTIGFVDSEVGLFFDNGRVAEAERLAKPRKGGNWLNSGTCDAFFPGLVFLQLLFGFRSSNELDHAIPDCDIGPPETRSLLDALFPKQPSHIWGVWWVRTRFSVCRLAAGAAQIGDPSPAKICEILAFSAVPPLV